MSGGTINYVGKVSFSINGDSPITFEKINMDLSCNAVQSKNRNIFNSDIISKKGYKLSAKMSIYIISETEKAYAKLFFQNILTQISYLNKLVVNIYGKYDEIIQTFYFDNLTEGLEYNNFLNKNYILGMSFDIAVERGELLLALPVFWKDTSYNPHILSASILLEDFVI